MLTPDGRDALDVVTGRVMAAPLLIGEQLLGVLQVGADRDRPFDRVDLEAFGPLADRAVVAVNNARLYEDALLRMDHRPDHTPA